MHQHMLDPYHLADTRSLQHSLSIRLRFQKHVAGYTPGTWWIIPWPRCRTVIACAGACGFMWLVSNFSVKRLDFHGRLKWSWWVTLVAATIFIIECLGGRSPDAGIHRHGSEVNGPMSGETPAVSGRDHAVLKRSQPTLINYFNYYPISWVNHAVKPLHYSPWLTTMVNNPG